MNESTRQRYENHYTAAVSAFIRDAGDVNASGIPEVHLPLWGTNYDTTKLKMAFIGRDTRGWRENDMPGFLNDAKQNIQTAIFRSEATFHELRFTGWTIKFGTSFFDSVLRFLAKFNGIANWKELKKRQHDELLRTFVWANTNAVEQWSGRCKSADFDAWKRLKSASERHLDSFSAILDVFHPHIVIVMNWGVAGTYWGRPFQWESIGDHVVYARDASLGTHVFNTAHPSWLNRKGMREAAFETIWKKWLAIRAPV